MGPFIIIKFVAAVGIEPTSPTNEDGELPVL